MGRVKTGLLKELPAPPTGREGWPWTTECDPSVYVNGTCWPKISIVTPSYNQGAFIEESIRSILLQNYPNLEYIIVDGGSNDQSTEILKKYNAWIHFWVSEEDNGQSHAINKGLKRATGEIFNWINSDDYLTPLSLFEIAKAFTSYPKCRLVVSPINFVTAKGKLIRVNPPTKVNPLIWDTLQAKGLNQPGMFFSLPLLKALSGVNERFHYSMDLDLWKRYLLTFGDSDICRIDHKTVNFRFQDDSKSVGAGWEEHSAFDIENKKAFLGYALELKNDTIYNLLRRELKLPDDPIPMWKQEKPVRYDRLARWMEYISYNLFLQGIRKGKILPILSSARALGPGFFLKKLLNKKYFLVR